MLVIPGFGLKRPTSGLAAAPPSEVPQGDAIVAAVVLLTAATWPHLVPVLATSSSDATSCPCLDFGRSTRGADASYGPGTRRQAVLLRRFTPYSLQKNPVSGAAERVEC